MSESLQISTRPSVRSGVSSEWCVLRGPQSGVEALALAHDVAVPRMMITRRRARRRATIRSLEPQYPGYLFIREELLREMNLSVIHQLWGLLPVCGPDLQYVRVPDEQLEHARWLEAETVWGVPHDPIRVGDSVLVDRGPMVGWSGHVILISGEYLTLRVSGLFLDPVVHRSHVRKIDSGQ